MGMEIKGIAISHFKVLQKNMTIEEVIQVENIDNYFFIELPLAFFDASEGLSELCSELIYLLIQKYLLQVLPKEK